MIGVQPEERFSGHESFVCRYGWLRKAYDGVSADPGLFTDLDRAIVALGVNHPCAILPAPTFRTPRRMLTSPLDLRTH